LKQTNNSDYYKDTNLIHSEITGIPPPDISDYEIRAKKDFKQLINIFPEISTDRDNFLRSYFTLYQILQRHGYRCNSDDFKLLKTENCLQRYNETFKKMFNKLSWKFVPCEL